MRRWDDGLQMNMHGITAYPFWLPLMLLRYSNHPKKSTCSFIKRIGYFGVTWCNQSLSVYSKYKEEFFKIRKPFGKEDAVDSGMLDASWLKASRARAAPRAAMTRALAEHLLSEKLQLTSPAISCHLPPRHVLWPKQLLSMSKKA